MDKLYNFHYAMFLANQQYGLNLLPENFEEVGLIAYNLIGNKITRLYKICLDIDCDSNSLNDYSDDYGFYEDRVDIENKWR